MRFRVTRRQLNSFLVRAANYVPKVGISGLACLSLAVVGIDDVNAATTSNAQSPLGINLLNVNYSAPEQPFLNIFLTSGVAQAIPAQWSGGWLTHSTKTNTWDTGEEAYVQVDASGYPTTLTASSSDPHSPQLFDSVGVLLLRSLPNSNAGTGLPYLAGQYAVDYDGEGTLAFGFDAAVVSSSPGRYVFNVANPTTGGGISVSITSTDPNHTGNYLRNIRIVKAELESQLLAGNVFSPAFLNRLQNFRIIRGMQWLEIDNNGGYLTNWSQRPTPTDAGWGGPNGVPLEGLLQLCNAVGADCWMNAPHMASNDYITQMATLAHKMLGTSQKAYIEYSNEVWNGGYAQYNYAATQGQAMWPNAGTGADYNGNWYGMRAAQTCDIWKSVWGADASRVVCVMGAQAANPYTASQSLSCPLWTGNGNAPCASHGINVVAIAPYILINTQSSWTSASDGGLSGVFAAINSTGLPTSSSWEAAYKTALAPYGLPYVAYEGGQSLVGFATYQNGSPMVNLFIAANRDQRMGTAYTTMLNNWKSNGGQSMVIFADIYAPSQYGEWGALESLLDTVSPLSSAPPKWQAIQNFIAANNCWWPGCVGAIGTTSVPNKIPMAPVLTVK